MFPKYLKYLALFLTTLVIMSCGDDESEPEINEIQEFVKTYGGSSVDEAVSVVQADDGDYMVLGRTRSTDGDVLNKTTTDVDFWLLKINPSGDIVWSKTYGGSDDDNATKISKTNDGGYILTGYSLSSDGDVSGNEGFFDYWLIKIDAEGNKQWDKNFGFSGSDQALGTFQTADGGYFMTGFLDVTASNGGGNDLQRENGNAKGTLHGVGEYWGIRLDANGNKLWRRYFGGSNNDRSYGALQTNDGGFLMTGASESNDFDKTDPKGSYDYWAVRLDQNGTKLWTKSFGGSQNDSSYGVTKTSDGNYIMVGDSRSDDIDVINPKGSADVWVVKFDDDGKKIWSKSIGGSDFETAHSIVQKSNGNFVLGGHSRSSDGDITGNNGVNDAVIIEIDATGNLKNTMNFGGTDLDFGEAVMVTKNNSVILVGNTESNDLDIQLNRGSKDFLVVKVK